MPKKRVIIFAALIGCGLLIFLILRTQPVLLSREIVTVQDYGELTGKILAESCVGGDLGKWLEKNYTLCFEANEITAECPLKERIYASVEYRQEERELTYENLFIPGTDMHPSHVIVIAVLEGRILHETATYQWLGGFQYTKERYFVDNPKVVVYGLFAAISSTTVYISNNDRTDYETIENYREMKNAIASPAVANLVH